MPVFAADVLPDTTGRNLGSPPQRWNAYLQNVDIQGIMNYQPVPGTALGPTGVLSVLTIPAGAGSNVTTWQTLSTVTIPGGLLNAMGKAIRGTMGGIWTVQAGQTPNMDIACNLAGLQVFGVSASGLAAGQSNMTWRAMWEGVVTTPGSAGQLTRHGQFLSRYTTGGGNEAMAPIIDVNYLPAGPIDFTVDEPLAAVCRFTTNTSPANSVTLDVFIVEILN